MKKRPFYSRATDAAGNQEAAPVSADATTHVSLTNLAPTLAAIPDQQIIEGETLTLDLSANDPDGRSDLLSYAFTSAVPPGITLDSRTGRIRWVTGEADGGREVIVTVRVTDVGFPAQSVSRSFAIRVPEDNQAPILNYITPQRVAVNAPLTIQVIAQDGDLPTQTIQFSFAAPPPTGMTIGANSGLIMWQPTAAYADSTVLVTVSATDSGSPAKQATISFPITVDPTFADRPPQFLAAPALLWLADTVHTVPVSAFDPDGDSVSMTLNTAGLPGGLTFTSADGTGLGLIRWDTTGVTPGMYQLPIEAIAGPLRAGYAQPIKVVANNAYWQWAVDAFDHSTDLQAGDPDRDKDQDATANVFEWALLRDPQAADSTAMAFTLAGPIDGRYAAEFSLHRRRGSDEFVSMKPEFSLDLKPGSWLELSGNDWEVMADPTGDDDQNPDTEQLLFRAWLNPPDLEAKRFFRVNAWLPGSLP